MNATILNRELKHPTDGWYHIEPSGEHPAFAEDGTKVVQVIDGAAVAAMVKNFEADSAAYEEETGNPFPGVLLDREHFSHNEDKETAADGWLKALQDRAGQLFGRIDWTPRGKAATDGGEYKFFSTEYNPGDLETVGKDATGALRVRPRRLSGLSLTNRPNNKGGRPITNRNLSPDAPAARPARELADTQKPNMKKVAEKLGLSAEASEDAILDELQKLLDKAKANQEAEKEQLSLQNRVKELESQLLDTDLAAHGITKEEDVKLIKPLLSGVQNREQRTAILKRFAGSAKPEGREPLTLRNRAQAPAGQPSGDAGEPTATERKLAARIRNRAADLRKSTRGLSLQASYRLAESQIASEDAGE